MKPQIEPATTERLLKCFGLAVDEAKFVKQVIETRHRADALKQDQAASDRLILLNREIAYLEGKLEEVRKQANQK